MLCSWLWIVAAACGGASSGEARAGPPTAGDAVSAPLQPLGDALRALAKEANLQILFDADVVSGRTVIPLSAALPARAALEELLRGTSLEAHEQAPGVIVIRRRQEIAAVPPAANLAKTPDPVTSPKQASALGEIVITAERREELLQEVPISVSAYGKAAMDERGARSIDDIARLTPGVVFGRGINYNSQSSDISIRGIESIAGAATTGVYIDDTPIQSRHLSFGTYDAYPQLFDLDRVEVLRGPQGTLFGSGSEGGTIRFITPDPQLDRTSAYARSEVGATERGGPIAEFGIAGGAPVIDDTVAFRASVSYRYEDGYVDRIDWHTRQTVAPDSNAATTGTARFSAKWAVNERLSVTASLYYQREHADDTAAWWAPVPGTPDPTGGQFDGPFRNGNGIAGPNTDSFALSALKIDWNLGSVRLFSNTSYFTRNQRAVTDYSEYDRAVFLGNPYPPAGIEAPTYWADDQRNWTQEVRLESADGGGRFEMDRGALLSARLCQHG